MKLLLTSYKLHDSIHEAASPGLSAWLEANAKKWKVQVKWDLPAGDTEKLTELVGTLRNMLAVGLTPKREKAVERLIAQIEGTEEATPVKPKTKPRPKPAPAAVEVPAAAKAPEAPQAFLEPISAPNPALVAQITLPTLPTPLTLPTAPSKPAPRLAPEESPVIPPPELRAAALLGSLFDRIQHGE